MIRTARIIAGLGVYVAAALVAAPAGATDIYRPGEWPALASDRTATNTGDSLTVLVLENSSGSNSSGRSGKAKVNLSGQAGGNSSLHSGQIGGSGALETNGQSDRSGRLIAQFSVVVDGVLPNGDLHVAGEQTLNINGKRTHIRLSGRVRRADIGASNTVLSSRVAEASIDYDGAGFESSATHEGVLRRIRDWLGL